MKKNNQRVSVSKAEETLFKSYRGDKDAEADLESAMYEYFESIGKDGDSWIDVGRSGNDILDRMFNEDRDNVIGAMPQLLYGVANAGYESALRTFAKMVGYSVRVLDHAIMDCIPREKAPVDIKRFIELCEDGAKYLAALDACESSEELHKLAW